MKSYSNKGFSYIELLLVITIMSLMAGFSAIAIGTVNRNNVSRTADKVYASINSGRSSSLTNGTKNGWCNFTVKNGNLYCYCGKRISNSNPVNFSTQNWDKICTKAITLKYGPSGTTKLNEGDVLSLNFKQSTGEFNGYKTKNVSDATDCTTGNLKITITNNSNKSKTLTINKFGKIE